ncbi:class II fructose-bisphosphate aldolase [Cupriavidus basilensis]
MKTPSDYDYNVDVTRRVCEMAHAVGVSVEVNWAAWARSKPARPARRTASAPPASCRTTLMLTDPEDRRATSSRAPAMRCAGHCHRHQPWRLQVLAQADRRTFWRWTIRGIHQKIPGTHLVMHDASSVPQEWLEIIRQYGGDIKETYGVPVEEILRGIKTGVRKVNIDTDIRLAMTGAIRKSLSDDRSEFDPAQGLAGGQEGRQERGAVALRGVRLCGTGLEDQAGAVGKAGAALPLGAGETGGEAGREVGGETGGEANAKRAAAGCAGR